MVEYSRDSVCQMINPESNTLKIFVEADLALIHKYWYQQLSINADINSNN